MSSFIVVHISAQLTAAIVFLSLGIMASFLCLVIDGVFIVFNMVNYPRPSDRLAMKQWIVYLTKSLFCQ